MDSLLWRTILSFITNAPTITIKNLRLGKEVSAQTITREDWTSNKKAQITVREEDLVNEIKKLL